MRNGQQHDDLISQPQAAALIGTTPQTLRDWRVTGRGPRWREIGGRYLYRVADVRSWLRRSGWRPHGTGQLPPETRQRMKTEV